MISTEVINLLFLMREMAKEKAGAEMQYTGIAVIREVLGTGIIAGVQMMPAA